MMTDLYIDKCKFQGRDVVGKVPVLLAMLSDSADIDYILDFFEVPPLTVSTMCVFNVKTLAADLLSFTLFPLFLY